jgi:hypothetical protein
VTVDARCVTFPPFSMSSLRLASPACPDPNISTQTRTAQSGHVLKPRPRASPAGHSMHSADPRTMHSAWPCGPALPMYTRTCGQRTLPFRIRKRRWYGRKVRVKFVGQADHRHSKMVRTDARMCLPSWQHSGSSQDELEQLACRRARRVRLLTRTGCAQPPCLLVSQHNYCHGSLIASVHASVDSTPRRSGTAPERSEAVRAKEDIFLNIFGIVWVCVFLLNMRPPPSASAARPAALCSV